MDDPGSVIASPYLGEIRWNLDCELNFPAGLPGFERQQRIVPVEIPSQRPLVYLQSALNPEICFLALPVSAVYPGYELCLGEDDCALLEFDPVVQQNGRPLAEWTDVLCLALLCPSGPTVKTNLDAPIVINLHNGRGVQAVAPAAAAGTYRLSREGNWEALC